MLDKCCGKCFHWLRLDGKEGKCYKGLLAPPGVEIDAMTNESEGRTCPHFQVIVDRLKPWEVS